METGELIIYTSADPVLQIAAHEDIIPVEELYRICEFARSITLERPALLGRIIARSLQLVSLGTLLVHLTVVTWLFHHLLQPFWTN